MMPGDASSEGDGVMRVLVSAGVWAILIGGWSPSLRAQSALPDGPGRDVTVRLCSNCHSPETLASQRLSTDGWRDLIKRMVSVGAEGTPQELEAVFQYLSTHFPVETQPALNLNTATSVELESVAGLLRKESAALVTYRERNGPCKQLEDLKKVPGLDYRKIEARKERLTCM
jgi:competence protein ComEA